MSGTTRIAPAQVRVDVAALSEIGKVRETNEDAFLVCRIGRYLERLSSNLPEALVPRLDEAGIVMIVADGMGGHAAGEVASHTAIAATVRKIIDTPRWTLNLDDPATREREIDRIWQRAREFLASIHAAVQERAASDRSLQGMGTTLTSVYSVGTDLFVVHVGDSRAYLFRAGQVRKMTRDHTLAQQYVDLGLLRPEDAGAERLSHVLTQAVGADETQPVADLHRFELTAGDRVLLCTDGLSNLVGEAEMAAVLGRKGSPHDACRALVDLALERGGHDNATVIVADYSVDREER